MGRGEYGMKDEAKETQEKSVEILRKMANRIEKGEFTVTGMELECFTHPLAVNLGSYKLEVTYYER